MESWKAEPVKCTERNSNGETMKVGIIYTFDTFRERVALLKEYYHMKGAEVTTYTSNFSHVKKEKIVEDPLADIQIDVHSYSKNLSFRRLYSHYHFAQTVEKLIRQESFDLLHVMVPCNSLVHFMTKVKQYSPQTKIIFDLIDLWPETMPISRFKNMFPFTAWKNLREKTLDQADLIFTECKYFQQVLGKEQSDKYHVLYWTRSELPLERKLNLSEDELRFCYLGSMNNIIDIDFIVSLLSECSKYRKVVLHLIGDGESKKKLIHKAQGYGIKVIDHHKIYDQHQKQKVFDQCNYGLNVMKETVVVGLTMKSLDYMCGQLPIISTIRGDTKDFCERYNIGFYVPHEKVSLYAQKICVQTLKEQEIQRDQIKDLYMKYFTKQSFFDSLDQSLKQGDIYVD